VPADGGLPLRRLRRSRVRLSSPRLAPAFVDLVRDSEHEVVRPSPSVLRILLWAGRFHQTAGGSLRMKWNGLRGISSS
jgi:hypothetical protein